MAGLSIARSWMLSKGSQRCLQQLWARSISASASLCNNRVAVVRYHVKFNFAVCDFRLCVTIISSQVLSGCGVYDGSELHEASA